MALKLQSFQQVNRSQNALVRGGKRASACCFTLFQTAVAGELQKTRRKLAHMQCLGSLGCSCGYRSMR